MTDAQRLSTTYCLFLDSSTARLLQAAPLGPIDELDSVSMVALDPRQSRLIYTVPWARDNEYVHKALRKKLRIWINALKRLEPEAGA